MKTKEHTQKDKYYGKFEEQDNSQLSSSLIDYEEVEETPFTIVTDEKGSFVVMGSYRLTTSMTKEEAREDAKRTDWFRIMQVIEVMNETRENAKKLTNKN